MKTADIPDYAVLSAYEKSKADPSKLPESILMREFDAHPKVCAAACVRAFERGLIDYGVSLRTGWITDKGWRVLRG